MNKWKAAFLAFLQKLIFTTQYLIYKLLDPDSSPQRAFEGRLISPKNSNLECSEKRGAYIVIRVRYLIIISWKDKPYGFS
jgi:hypothetical protein